MKFKSLERIIKEVAFGSRKETSYMSVEHSIRNVMEKKKHWVETDPNDQIVAGTYKTKSFEQSPEAQKLYSSLPKDNKKITPNSVEQSSILHDKLFDLHKDVVSKNRSSEAEVSTATDLVKKIKKLAKEMDLETEHNYIDRFLADINSHLDTSGNVVNAKDLDMEKLTSRFAGPSKDITKEKQDNDVDNSRFMITRNLKAQRKIKIIDAD